MSTDKEKVKQKNGGLFDFNFFFLSFAFIAPKCTLSATAAGKQVLLALGVRVGHRTG